MWEMPTHVAYADEDEGHKITERWEFPLDDLVIQASDKLRELVDTSSGTSRYLYAIELRHASGKHVKASLNRLKALSYLVRYYRKLHYSETTLSYDEMRDLSERIDMEFRLWKGFAHDCGDTFEWFRVNKELVSVIERFEFH